MAMSGCLLVWLSTHTLPRVLSSVPRHQSFIVGRLEGGWTCAGGKITDNPVSAWMGFVFHLLSCRCFLLHGIMHAVQDSLVNKITCCTRCAECHKYVKYKVCCLDIQLYHLRQIHNKKQNPFNTSNKQQHYFCVITGYFSSLFQTYMLLNFRFTGITVQVKCI